ncbi:terpenoid synthase [Aspergillus heteromorphus CBS 117.55]|uniref:Terpene synthase n=1 Tax=Aspergillus heteromorphus CBS 117.55 TaxID=1448321 RepID=A0A317WYE2_9EURO|nr:terpenoid synthase [Aspergillus heteromorphus CBS 117.55]PWY89220.1 terpenoid synthase [Aspergillus heteromorphus CBS 117.55]
MDLSEKRAAIPNTLRGQSLLIPDLAALIYPDWTVGRHDHERELKAEIEGDFLVRYVPSAKKQQQLKRSNAAMLAGYFWSGSSVERFRPLAQFMYWFFCWNDEFGCSNLRNDREGTEAYGQASKGFLRWCLDPDNYHQTRLARPAIQGYHNCDSFQEIGEAMQIGHSRDALNRFADSLYKYIDSVCSVQETRSKEVPTLDEYLLNRIHPIGAFPCIMAMEFAYALTIPAWVYSHETSRTMFRETAVSCIIVNDVLSLKNKVAADRFDNVIPLKMLQLDTDSAQTALEDVIKDLQKSRRTFSRAEYLLQMSSEFKQLSQETKDNVQVLIQGCKNMMLGNIKWSLSNSRYILDKYLEGSAARVTL